MEKVLITGAAGFLGSHLCDRFIKEGYSVIGMDNLITGNLKNIEHLFPLEQFEFYNHDVSNYVHVPGELKYILHFAIKIRLLLSFLIILKCCIENVNDLRYNLILLMRIIIYFWNSFLSESNKPNLSIVL